jgi:arginine decarboxylase
VFHALPVSRGKSISQSHWIDDMGRFYGQNIFLAETSATSGGLDSLLQPAGPIKRAHKRAAKAFGSDRTFFVTNGTSTANKIVMQALVRPGDIVLVSRDCHKSHHYALMLAGAHPVYLDAYPLPDYSMYGAVPLDLIKQRLLELRDAGKLDRVRMVLLTNCTFDGITYNPYKVMKEILEIKPDMVFLWDEAWFAYGYFNPTLRQRTAMAAAKRLRDELSSEEGTDKRVRVYATQSTHKTLTSLRQGSMIHVADDDFEHIVSEAFDDAFMTHTSTSPNYQIIASLDLGRRQVELEGYELVQRAMSLAMSLRERVNEHPDVRRYFSVLRPADMIPEGYRPSGIEAYYDPDQGWARMERAWREDEFCLDPTRVNIHIGRTGVDGDSFRRLLMDDHDIQINKTSRNTALFMTNIGTTRGDIAYLVDSFANIAVAVDEERRLEGDVDASLRAGRVSSLTQKRPSLPGFGRFHAAFSDESSGTPEGDIRSAFFAGSDPEQCEHKSIAELRKAAESGEPGVSGGFVTPYPPGFPVLVPGQIVSAEILDYLAAVDVKEIHGYKEGHGLRVLSAESIEQAQRARQRAAGSAVARSVTVGKQREEEEEASS